MESKLTLQDIMLYNNALLMYDKTQIFNISFDENLATGVGKVSIIRLHDEQIQLIDNNIVVWTESDNCKLILRDITELTDEEEEVMMRQRENGRVTIPIRDKNEHIITCDYEIWKIDYLRSINIDIDGFIESGKAVKG